MCGGDAPGTHLMLKAQRKICSHCNQLKTTHEFGFRTMEKDTNWGRKSTRVYCLRCKSQMDSATQKLQRIIIKKLVETPCELRDFYLSEKAKIINSKPI